MLGHHDPLHPSSACDLDTGWMVLPVVCGNRQGGGRGVFDCVRACGRACVAEAVPQTITEGVTVLVLFMTPLWDTYIHD